MLALSNDSSVRSRSPFFPGALAPRPSPTSPSAPGTCSQTHSILLSFACTRSLSIPSQGASPPKGAPAFAATAPCICSPPVLGRHSQGPQAGGLKQHTFLLSQFWSLKVQNQGVVRVVSSLASLLGLRMSTSSLCFHITFPPDVCVIISSACRATDQIGLEPI